MEAEPSPVLGEGMLEAYLGVHLDGLGLEEEADAPFVPFGCREMQCCPIAVVLLKTNERPTRNEYTEAGPSHVLGEGMLEAYLGVDLDRLGLEEEADAPFVP